MSCAGLRRLQRTSQTRLVSAGDDWIRTMAFGIAETVTRVISSGADLRRSNNRRNLFWGGHCMIRLACAIAAPLFSFLSIATAQPAPTTASRAPTAAIEDLVLANKILNDRGVLDAYG